MGNPKSTIIFFIVSVLAKIHALRGSSVVRYGLTNLLPRSVAILSTLVLTPLAIGRLGILEYGIWALATLIPNLVSSPDFGVTYGVVNEMAKVHREHGHLRGERERLLGLTRLLGLIALGWLTVGSLGLAWYVFGGNVQTGLDPSLVYISLVTALAMFTLGIPPSLWGRVQLAQERGHEYVLWEGIGKVVSLGASLLVLLLAPSLVLLVIAALLPNALAAYFNAWQYVRTALGKQTEPSWPLSRVLQENRIVFGAGKYFFAFQVAYLIGNAVDPFLINKLLGTREVAYLTVARRPFEALPLAVTLFSTALWPVFNRMNAENRISDLRRVLVKLLVGSAGMLAILSIIIIVFSSAIYGYLGQGKLEVEKIDLVWISIFYISTTCIMVLNSYMNAVDLLSKQMWVLIFSAVLGVVVKASSLRIGGISSYFFANSVTYIATALIPMAWIVFQHIRKRSLDQVSLT